LKRMVTNQRGSETTYSIIGLVILVIILFLAFKLAVPFFKNMSLSQYAQELVNYDYQNSRPNPNGVKSIQSKLVNRIKQKDMPIGPKQVKVDYDLEKYAVQIDYSYPVNLLVFEFDWDFKILRESEKH